MAALPVRRPCRRACTPSALGRRRARPREAARRPCRDRRRAPPSAARSNHRPRVRQRRGPAEQRTDGRHVAAGGGVHERIVSGGRGRRGEQQECGRPRKSRDMRGLICQRQIYRLAPPRRRQFCAKTRELSGQVKILERWRNDRLFLRAGYLRNPVVRDAIGRGRRRSTHCAPPKTGYMYSQTIAPSFVTSNTRPLAPSRR